MTVTALAVPGSGGSAGTVAPGTTVTYTLDAASEAALPSGATVVDDLSGLLANATISSSAAQL
ncbi:MAG: hypothetical protein FWC87_10635, partial [Acidimicrobiaceae bacterium]|nr:hypothetical protein [Acidimicrobiaceae bacterium]